MITTVIFDLDGTLIDTEKYYRKFWPIALKEFGWNMTDQQALAMRSLGHPFAPALLKQWFGEELDYSAVRDCRRKMMEDYLSGEQNAVERKPGSRELLCYLKERGIHTAIATASGLERTIGYLEQVGLYSYIDKVISASMVKEGKPSPDIYQFACEQLSQPPGNCLAVEDSPNGIWSAYQAGCSVVMIPDQTPPDKELSDILFACFDNLIQIKTLFEP